MTTPTEGTFESCSAGKFLLAKAVDGYIRLFFRSAALILAATAAAKLLSAMGSAPILSFPDEVLMVSYRAILIAAACIEIVAAAFLLLGRQTIPKLLLLSWLSSAFCCYRLANWWAGTGNYCPCIGTIYQDLHLSKTTADLLLDLVISYLLVSCVAGFIMTSIRQKSLH